MESIKNMLSGKNTCTGKCKEKHEEGNKEKIYTTSSFKNKKKDNFDECVICLEKYSTIQSFSLHELCGNCSDNRICFHCAIRSIQHCHYLKIVQFLSLYLALLSAS